MSSVGLETPPGTDGTLIDIVPGQIGWLRMPLPMALNHINLYLVRDGAGWRMIDTGIDTAETRGLWEKILPALDGPVTGIICTHHHSDHCGLSGWLTERLRVPLYMSRGEYFAMRMFSEQFSFDAWEYREFFTRAGLSEDRFEQLVAMFASFRTQTRVARAFQRLRDGETLSIGEHRWEIRGGEGHSPEHASLYCREFGILLSGDQLLARISPNVGVLPFEPNANPLAEWFASLERIGRLPAATLVLPAHELPFRGPEKRARELTQHHLATLDRLQSYCAQSPDSVVGLSYKLFPDRRSPMDDILAISETLAHLAYLLAQGRVAKHRLEDGSDQYRNAG
ncbi:MAG: MBL fold metallo-hydrolase [Rhodocyclaceae bacterium]|nr:MBL fold metallo-hydrolase [Rhodocyclaceae bacterium]